MAEVIISEELFSVVITDGDDPSVIVSEQQNAVIVANGERGATGESDKFVTYTASVALSGNRVVCLNGSGELIYGDSATVTHAHKILGITTGAVSSGATGTVQTTGEMTEAGWSWMVGSPVYLSTNGTLSHTAPSSGFVLVIGFALTATKVFIDIKQPIILT